MNYIVNKELASNLLSLKISVQSKVELWLVHKDLKPVASVVLESDFDQESKNYKNIINWFSAAEFKCVIDSEKKQLFHVSKDINKAKRASEIMWIHKFNETIEKGKLFGFPEKATLVFAEEIVKGIHPARSKLLVGTHHHKTEIDDKYWKPYVRYLVRSDNIMEDSMVAKKWADLIREEIPILAASFESVIANAD